jgi:hypothetical protein
MPFSFFGRADGNGAAAALAMRTPLATFVRYPVAS